MHDLNYIVARNARAMADADEHGMGRRPDPHVSRTDVARARREKASRRRETRDALIAAALRSYREGTTGSIRDLYTAVRAYRSAHCLPE